MREHGSDSRRSIRIKEGDEIDDCSCWREGKTVPFIEPPDAQRCARNDGKSWQCNRWKVQNEKYCEVHLLQVLKKYTERQEKKVKEQNMRKQKENKRGRRDLEAAEEDEEEEVLRSSRKKKGSNPVIEGRREDSSGKDAPRMDWKRVSKEKQQRVVHHQKKKPTGANKNSESEEQETKGSAEEFNSCHQCWRRDSGRSLVRCKSCSRGRYCSPCIRNW